MATQQERREASIARLLDAAIEVVSELGYDRASAATIASRAGLSHGALFRHFPTMSDFMAATAEEALDRQLEDFTARAGSAGPDLDLPGVLTILRAVIGSPTNTVIYELLNAARSDANLAGVLQLSGMKYAVKIREVARGLPGLRDLREDVFDTLLLMVTDMFDAEAILRPVRPLSDDDLQRRDAVLLQLYSWVTDPGLTLSTKESLP